MALSIPVQLKRFVRDAEMALDKMMKFAKTVQMDYVKTIVLDVLLGIQETL